MQLRAYLGLFLISLCVLLGVAAFQSAPGYMDADYYLTNGLTLAKGDGWWEPFLWNYLDDPFGLPHQAFNYWMPFAAYLATIGVRITGWANFSGARHIFIALAACVPLFTAYLAYRLTRQRWAAWLAGLLAIFSGFYLAFLPTTDTFAIVMLLGGLFVLITGEISTRRITLPEQLFDVEKAQTNIFRLDIGRIVRHPLFWSLLLGGVVGLMHFSRADGLIWLGVGLVVVVLPLCDFDGSERDSSWLWQSALRALVYSLGYLLVMGPWYLRNLVFYKFLFPPGNSRTLWLTAYDQIFSYPAEILNPQSWLASGWLAIIQARLWALWTNLQTAFAVQGLILLFPLVIWGLWRLRRDRRIWLPLLGWALIFGLMTLAFPFPGARGGFFHSGAALQILFWAVVPVGLEAFIDWMSAKRNWEPLRSRRVLFGGIVLLVAFVTGVVSYQKVIGADPANPIWGSANQTYVQVEAELQNLGVDSRVVVMVNNPPGYYLVAGRPAVVIPDGELATTMQAAQAYQAAFLLLDQNYPDGLADIYNQPGDRPGLIYLGTVDGTQIYHLTLLSE